MSDCVVALTKIATLSKSVTESQKHVNSLPELIQYLQVGAMPLRKEFVCSAGPYLVVWGSN